MPSGTEYILIAVIVVLILLFIVYVIKNKRGKKSAETEVDKEKLDALFDYVNIQKSIEEEKRREKEFKKADNRDKLEAFRRDKQQLKEQLAWQLNSKQWTPLKNILTKLDKGGVGIYVLFNETKNKYYVGQSKELYARIKKHFEIEQIALDYVSGDAIKVKILSASEFSKDFRIDHMEKAGIEIFGASETGYNKTGGNL